MIASAFTPEQYLIEQADARAVRAAINDLPVRERKVIVSYYGIALAQPRTYAAIARHLGVTPRRCHQIAVRAHKRLRSRLAELAPPRRPEWYRPWCADCGVRAPERIPCGIGHSHRLAELGWTSPQPRCPRCARARKESAAKLAELRPRLQRWELFHDVCGGQVIPTSFAGGWPVVECSKCHQVWDSSKGCVHMVIRAERALR